jgi:hypothetical protein
MLTFHTLEIFFGNDIVKGVALHKSSLLLRIDLQNMQTLQLN